MVIQNDLMVQQVKNAQNYLDGVSRQELMGIRQERISACGAFNNDCNGVGVMYIRK